MARYHAMVSKVHKLFSELRRRRVFQVAAGYAAFAFVGIEVANLVYPTLGLRPWAYPVTVYALIGATPIVLILAWLYDITSEGIQLTPPVEAVAASSQALPAPVFSPRSIAILPFTNLAAEGENEYFSDGITEDIIARVSRITDLKVISRTSVMQYKGTHKTIREIGRELGVATILEGSVRRAGERVRIVAQLLDARTDAHKWAETYDRVLDDIFAIQSDVANHIAAALLTELSPQERERMANQPTENLAAYDLYLRAREQWNLRTPAALEQSEKLLRDVVQMDEKFALAWAGLADTYAMLGVYGGRAPKEVMPRAREAAEKGLRVDATLVEALTALAVCHAVFEWDYASASRAFDAAMEMGPQYPIAPQWLANNVLVPQKRFDEAEKMITRAIELDPLSPSVNTSLAVLAYYRRDYELTVRVCDEVIALNPTFTFGYYFRGLAEVQLGQVKEGIATLQRSMPAGTESMAALAHAYAVAGQEKEARAIIADLEAAAGQRYVSPSLLAQPYVALGDHARALLLLEEAVQVRATDLVWLGVRPTFDPLRNEPRFERVLGIVGLGA